MRTLGKVRHVAGGMLASFISRNNDLGGYWALGQLYAEADPGTKTVVLDLLDGSARPARPACRASAARYARFLRHALEAHGVAPADLARADITVNFDVVPDVRLWSDPYGSSPGDPTLCTVTLALRDGRTAVARQYVHCWRHSTLLEARSARSGAEA